MQAPALLIRSGVANDRGRLRPTLPLTLEAALSISDSMIDELQQQLAPVLDTDREGAPPLGLEQLDPDLVARLAARPDALKRDWHRELRQVLFHGLPDASVARTTVRFDDICLLDDEQINASIEFASVEQGLLAATSEVLPRLNALVSQLMGWLSVQPELNPLRPRAYAVALRSLLVQHLPDSAERERLFMPVAHLMGESLRQVYRELVQWLQAHGVEPLRATGMRQAGDEPPSQTVGRTLLTLGRLRQLLTGDLLAAADGGPQYLHTVPASINAIEDLGLIEPLLRRLRERRPPPDATEDPAAPELPVVDGQLLGRLIGQEVVQLMLEHLTHDERLLPPIRQQLVLLEPALVRLSQAEPRFFSDRQHPARQLLEAVTQRSLGYQTLADEGFAELLSSVATAVRSVNRVEATEETFARLLRRLRRVWEQDDARKLQRRADAARALMHAEQRQIWAERLADEWRQRLHDKTLPAFVRQFLLGPWAQAVAESRLVPGGAEDTPLEAMTDELVWSAQPALVRRDLDRLGRLVPRLVAQIRLGLQRIGYPEERTGLFLDALVALHQRALDVPTLTEQPVAAPSGDCAVAPAMAPTPDTAGAPAAAPSADAAGADAARVAADGPEGLDRPVEHGDSGSPSDSALQGLSDNFWIAGQAAEDAGFLSGLSGPMPLEPLAPLALGTGAWVDLRVKGEWVRAQLTWTSPRGGLYMFISSQGLAHSMTQRTLDKLLANDALRIISSGGVVEGALDAVAWQALQNSGEAGAGGLN